jgi:secreted PhoX family phosphatase
MCEDADERRQYIRGLTQDGKIFDIASSEMNHLELAGVTFSPDSQTMFCNTLGDRDRKRPGMTFAIWGPWERGAV